MRKLPLKLAIAVLLFMSIQTSRAESTLKAMPPLPKLFVWVIFDQMRADYLTLNYERFDKNPKGGFRWLIDHSAYYPFAEYNTLHCITAVGHSTLATGAYPHRTGIPLNSWFDSVAMKPIQSVDTASPDNGAEKPKASIGNLIGTTFSDELKNAYPGSHVVSVSFKDRGSLFTGGHRSDLSIWYGWSQKKWISNLDQSPVVDLLNEKLKKKPITELKTPDTFEFLDEAVESAVKNQKLGTHSTPDMLSVSYSNFDYAGHTHGPLSGEMVEMTLAADRSMKRLLALLDRTVPGGLANVVIAVTADHGAPPTVKMLKAASIEAGQFSPEKLQDDLNQHLRKKLGKPKGPEWVAYSNDLNFTFDPRSIGPLSNDDRHSAFEESKAYLSKRPELVAAFSRDDIRDRKLPGGKLETQILNSYFADRSGDVVAIPRPYFYEDGDIVAHMTGYSYDRQVPLILYGKPFSPGIRAQQAELIDLAPTFSFIARTIAPSQSEGRVLSEALKN